MTAHYTITITMKNSPNIVQMHYNSETSAAAEFASAVGFTGQIGFCGVSDDYGKKLSVDGREISAIVLSDSVGELEANQDLSLLQAHAQVKFQKRADADPVLMQAAQTANLRAKLAGGAANFSPRQ